MHFHTLLEKIKTQARPSEDVELLERAYRFAEDAHRGQKRKSGGSYIAHPLSIAMQLVDMRLDTKTVAAALLHDVLEDNPQTKEKLKNAFGDEIFFLIEGVTKLDKIRYQGSERSAESLRKMFLAIGEDIRIVLLKLMDRTHNMETLQCLSPEKQKRIALETLDIYAPLAYRLGMAQLSGKLEDLAFPYVHPKEHDWLMRATKEKFAKWSRYLAGLKPVLAEEIAKEKIPFLSISARVKHYYSLYKKLQKYDMDISKITDVVAMRVMLRTTEDCYATLGVIHKLWPPVPGKIKDYIALPKPNGYRSLHTTVFGPNGNMVEIQMRTPEMHEEAEYGIAAHWAYSDFKRDKSTAYSEKKTSFADQKQFAWIGQIREWQKEIENPDEFLESLKIDFFKSRIFVLSPGGDVLDLPEGATPVDFAYHIHTDIGSSTVGAKVNGKMVALDYRLKTGDVVRILTQKGKKPNTDWLKFAKSSQARKKITSLLKKMDESKMFERRGGETVEIRTTVKDRVGILRDITNVFARQKINLKNVFMETKNRECPVIITQISLRSRGDLEKILVRLKEIKEVEEISYRLL